MAVVWLIRKKGMRFSSSRDSLELSCRCRRRLELSTCIYEATVHYGSHTHMHGAFNTHAHILTYYLHINYTLIQFVTCAYRDDLLGQVDTTSLLSLSIQRTSTTFNKMDIEKLKTLLNCTLFQPNRSEAEIELRKVSMLFDMAIEY